MVDPVNVAVAIVGVLLTGWAAARPPHRWWLAGSVGLVFFVIHVVRLGADRTVAAGPWELALMVSHAGLAFLVNWLGHKVARVRRLRDDIERVMGHGLTPVEELPEVLLPLRTEATSLGFTPIPGGTGALGAQNLVLLAHPDGTYLTLVQTEPHAPGFGFSTPLTDGTWVESVPWLPGFDRAVIRVPGASLGELLEHHRAGLAQRIGPGSQPRPVDIEGGTQLLVARERETAERVLLRPWRNALVSALQQSPLKFLVLR